MQEPDFDQPPPSDPPMDDADLNMSSIGIAEYVEETLRMLEDVVISNQLLRIELAEKNQEIESYQQELKQLYSELAKLRH